MWCIVHDVLKGLPLKDCSKWSVDDCVSWLTYIKRTKYTSKHNLGNNYSQDFAELKRNISNHQINGQDLLEMTDSMLKKFMKVNNVYFRAAILREIGLLKQCEQKKANKKLEDNSSSAPKDSSCL